jgi:hypothetical protein
MICRECEQDKLEKDFLHSGDSLRSVCRACRAKHERITLREDIIKAYGSKCICCGENHPYFLGLDHVNDDGNLERETLKCHQIYAKAKKENYPPTYQLLCHNCNMAKSLYGVCPHKSKIEAQFAFIVLRLKGMGADTLRRLIGP